VFLLAADVVATPSAATPLDVPGWFWVAFCAGMMVLLALDMFVFHRDSHEPSLRESALWTLFWCVLALAFNGWVWWWAGSSHGIEFLIGYLVEWSLSMDNVFVFVVIFSFFGVPLALQYRVLFWGILGAIVLRLVFVVAAAGLLHYFEWMFYLFGAFLIYTAIKLATSHDSESHPEKNIFVRFGRKFLRIAPGWHDDHFFVRHEGRWHATTLFLVLLVIECTDVLFAVDSVPAIFGVTREPFIVFTSNIFAIMGLRALYFLLAGVMSMFRYLSYGLSTVLGFIGVKMLLHAWWEPPNWLSLCVIFALLGAAIGASVWVGWRETTAPPKSDSN
jgi:tellurite resistance protein TerC